MTLEKIIIIFLILSNVLLVYKMKKTRIISYWYVKRQGKIDGRKLYPPVEHDTLSHFEQELMDVAEGQINRLAYVWDNERTTLQKNYENSKDVLMELKDQLAQATTIKEKNKSKLEKEKLQLDNLEHVYLSKNLYIIIFWLLVIVELPLTIIAFEIIGEKPLFTLIAAFGLSFTVPVCGHFGGIQIRNGIFEEDTLPSTLLFCATASVVFALVGGIAYLRSFALEGSDLGLIRLSAKNISIVYLIASFGIYLSSLLASYFSHPKDSKLYYNTMRRIQDAQKTYLHSLLRVKKLATLIARTKRRYNDASAKLILRHKSYVDKAEAIRHRMQELVRVYRKTNVRKRPDDKRKEPKSFIECDPGKLMEDLPDSLKLAEELDGIDFSYDKKTIKRTLKKESLNKNITNISVKLEK